MSTAGSTYSVCDVKIALAQINTTVGDFAGNVRRILDSYRQAAARGSDIILFPELAIPGYPPLDLLGREDFIQASCRALVDLAPHLDGPPAVVGTIRRNESGTGQIIHDTAAVVAAGRVLGYHDKVLLPTYDVFDEHRYFEPGGAVQVWKLAGRRVGIAICEDLWTREGIFPGRRYRRNPAQELAQAGAELILCPSASPFHVHKPRLRDSIFLGHARDLGVPVVVCNLVGGNTELIFDGGSMVALPAGVAARARHFEEALLVVETEELAPAEEAPPEADERAEQIASAIVLGLRDYFRKCGFERAVIGLSGGIDSALTAALACEALGAAAVRGVGMPSRFSSKGSLDDARELARRLGMEFLVLSIEPVFSALLATLEPLFRGRPFDVAEENLQARARGLLLMAISNKLGDLVLATGNKSELAVGYCTLYGDMCGGLSPLGDVSKTDVYRLARLPRFRRVIPETTLMKPPSAELRENQTDQDTLPPYDVLDAILASYVEGQVSAERIARDGFPPALVDEVAGMVERNEYKRRQAAPSLRVTSKAFGLGRRMPIARRFGAGAAHRAEPPRAGGDRQ